jgi:hypothetical protein
MREENGNNQTAGEGRPIKSQLRVELRVERRQ